jgi:hypothetical protein
VNVISFSCFAFKLIDLLFIVIQDSSSLSGEVSVKNSGFHASFHEVKLVFQTTIFISSLLLFFILAVFVIILHVLVLISYFIGEIHIFIAAKLYST